MTQEGIEDLNRDGYLSHGSTIRMGRPFLNELFHVHPYLLMSSITVPTLTIHGTEDNMVPYEVARSYHQVSAPSEFLSIEGADHGFTVHGDEDYSDPQTRVWQQTAFDATVRWILKFTPLMR